MQFLIFIWQENVHGAQVAAELGPFFYLKSTELQSTGERNWEVAATSEETLFDTQDMYIKNLPCTGISIIISQLERTLYLFIYSTNYVA